MKQPVRIKERKKNTEKPKKRNDRNFANGVLYNFLKTSYKTEKEL